MVTELPAGGGDKGGLGGSSVGVGPGVPVTAVGDGNVVPLLASVGVSEPEGVCVGSGFDVPEPGSDSAVLVISGPGYPSKGPGVGLRFSPGPGYPETPVSILVGVGDCMLSV